MNSMCALHAFLFIWPGIRGFSSSCPRWIMLPRKLRLQSMIILFVFESTWTLVMWLLFSYHSCSFSRSVIRVMLQFMKENGLINSFQALSVRFFCLIRSIYSWASYSWEDVGETVVLWGAFTPARFVCSYHSLSGRNERVPQHGVGCQGPEAEYQERRVG